MSGQPRFIFPDKLAPQDYDETRDFFVRAFAAFPDVVGVYERGQVSVPGVSDLDLAIVVCDSPQDGELGRKVAEIKVPPSGKKVVAGSTIMVFAQGLASQVTVWDDMSLTSLSGPDVKLQEFCCEDERLLNMLRVLDWLPERILSLNCLLNKDEVAIVSVLGLLRSLSRTLGKAATLGWASPAHVDQIKARVDDLRENLFMVAENVSASTVDQVARDVLTLAEECLWTTAEDVVRQGIYPGGADAAGTSLWFKPEFGFSFCAQRPASVEGGFSGTVGVPCVWAVHLKGYAQGKGLIREKLQQAFTDISRVLSPRDNVLSTYKRRRMDLCEDMADFLWRYHFKRGLLKFGWFYDPQ